MPELPEVEIIRQSLNKKVKGKVVQKVLVKNRNLRFKVSTNFEKVIKNQKIIKVDRFSKYLILFFSNNIKCLVHLGMSGTIHLVYYKNRNINTNVSFYHSKNLPKTHNHVEFFFDKFKVVYNDPRRFGFFELINHNYSLKKRFKKLGPEPFNLEFNLNYILLYFKNKKKNVKNFLLDQSFVSGIGNIYANEILYLSKINPMRRVKSLTEQDCKKILLNSKRVLISAIKKGGSSIRDFKNVSGKKGNFQQNFKVYQREGLSCKKLSCKGIIEKKNISKRSSFFCNTCQK